MVDIRRVAHFRSYFGSFRFLDIGISNFEALHHIILCNLCVFRMKKTDDFNAKPNFYYSIPHGRH